ncbi:Ppx/GppA phosphatase family protein, partial [Faecalimonas sp.]
MNYSLIDIGSNSIRLTVYEINGSNFKTLFHSKIMAGLAGYVKKGKLSKTGIEVAQSALLEFKNILFSLSVENVSVFATASLRNIKNTEKVMQLLKEVSGFNIELIDEHEEALLSYNGAKLEFPEITEGTFTDIGGASTEIISFSNNNPTNIASYKIGSLNLYKNHVKRILPGKKSLANISDVIIKELPQKTVMTSAPNAPLICVGGTARATMKIARKIYNLPKECNTLTSTQVNNIFNLLTNNNNKSIRMILRVSPDRIHTIIPGLSILKNILLIY